jgi:hypothetical protein
MKNDGIFQNEKLIHQIGFIIYNTKFNFPSMVFEIEN